MDEVKSVRVRRKLASLDERHGSLDIKVTVYKGVGKRRIVKGFNNGSIVWPESIYDGDTIRALEDINNQYQGQGIVLSSIEDDCINDFVRVNTLRERPTGATISLFNSNTGKEESVNYYTIVQDPWSDTVPVQRSFGFDPYYLSNGSEVYIKWLTESYDKISYDISGMTASITASGSSASVTKIVVDVLPSNSKYPDFDIKFDYNGGSQSEIDSVVSSVIDQSIEIGFTNNGINYPKEGENIPSTLTYLMNGGEQYSDLNMNEVKTPSNIIKRVEIVPPKDSNGELIDKIFTLTDNNEFRYMSDVLSDPGLKQMSYSYSDKDIDIIKKIISNWELKVPTYKSQASLIGAGLMLCNPNYQSCLYTNYQSPLEPVKAEPVTTPEQDNLKAASSTTKTKLSVVFPTEFEVKVREDVPAFKIYVGEPPVEEEGSGFIFQDDMSDLSELSPEYIEDKFAGPEEDGSLAEELVEIAEINKAAEKEAESLGPLPPLIPGENPFANAKPGTTKPSEQGAGYPVDPSTTKFVNKYTNGIYPAKMHGDGTFVISNGKKSSNSKDRHWLTPNPEYVRRLSKIKVPSSKGDITVSVHPEFAAKLEQAFSVIRAKGLSKYIESCAGGLAVRNVTNGTRLSNHSYGFALDVNTTKDGWQYGAKWDVDTKTIKSGGKSRSWNSFDTGFYEIVKIMKSAGITWLGNTDPMHFSIHE